MYILPPKEFSVEKTQAFLREIGTIGWGGPHLEKWLRYAEAPRAPQNGNLKSPFWWQIYPPGN